MNWQQVAPGVILLLVKLTGTSLFFVFFPQIFPKGNITSISAKNSSVWSPSPEQTSSLSPLYPTTVRIPLKQPRWERFRGHDYLFSEEKAMWLISQFDCKLIWKSDLVIISDTKELEFIINKTAMANYFIGLTYSESTKKWEWIDHKEHNVNLFPIKATVDKDCAAIGADVSPVSCYDEYNWICEKTYS
ncbi:C-type lectin domain family 5 member A-like [Ahaetulla prasina]|uniref:C-type lectin domain family 5 member A-like n=1 Tax=Ahaetulla prasina TaxID=499056 RepID=UPI00264723BC|nr:C-type lectin domain family 5 member A-like [Ahaetulla prasina]